MSRKKKRNRVNEHQLFTVKPSVWKHLKQENQIDRAYRFRARKIERMHRLLQPISSLQSALFANKVNRISLEDHPPVFILGLWRSGTTHLHYMMARDPNLGYLNNHQAFSFNFSLLSFNKLNKFLNIFVPSKRPQDNVKLTLDEPAEEEQPFSTISPYSSIHAFFFPNNQDYFTKYHLFEGISEEEKKGWQKDYLFLLKNIAFYNNKKDLLLKNPHNTGRVKELLELFPDAKFIFLHRDPYTVFRSTKRLYAKMINTQFLQFMSLKETENLIIEQNARILDKYLRERSMIPKGNLVEVRFSDLEASPLETLSKIYNSLGMTGYEDALPRIKEYLGSTKDYKKNIYHNLPQPLIKKINRKWDSWFTEFEYQKN